MGREKEEERKGREKGRGRGKGRKSSSKPIGFSTLGLEATSSVGLTAQRLTGACSREVRQSCV